MIGRKPILVLIPALALAMTGCEIDWSAEYDEDGNLIETYDYVSVCQDRDGVRVDDSQCPADGHSSAASPFVWFYMPTAGGASAPPVGQRINPSAGSYRPPVAMPGGKAPSIARGGSVNPSGGTVQRGGFGVVGGKAGGSGS